MIGIIDIGNTFIHCCLAEGERIIKRKNFQDINDLKKFFFNINIILVISNSEEKREQIKEQLKGKKIYDFPVEKIKRNYEGRVGEDRIASAFYIKEKRLYPAIVLDAGTAITIDFINKNGVFSGGSILPGISIFLKSYDEINTLKFVEKSKKIKKIIGKNTKDCISSGLYIFIKGIKEYIKERNIQNVILTGGDALFFSEKGWEIDKDLVLKGGLCAFHKFFS